MSSSRLKTVPNFKDPHYNLSGCLLVASPSHTESPFHGVVCLVMHHSSEGAVGVVLNRSLPFEATKLIHGQLSKGIGDTDPESLKNRLHLGGPHAGPVVALHQRADLAEFASAEDVFLAAQASTLKTLLSDSGRPWKIFMGQLTWNPAELDRQFNQGLWLPIDIRSHIVFADVDMIWPLSLRHAANRVVQSLSGARMEPPDILMN